ncbi:MAG: GNAT family N-acetyltransferase [Pseudomonadota bacterium]
MAVLPSPASQPSQPHTVRCTVVRSRAITHADRSFATQLIETTLRRWIENDVGRWNASAMSRHIGARCAEGRWRILMIAGERIGLMSVEETAKELRVEQLFLEPAWQGQGIGKRLITYCKDRSRRRRKPLRLSVLHSNPARHFYNRCGFIEETRTRTSRKLVWFPD